MFNRSFIFWFISAAVVFSGADRIDFAFGSLPFSITPAFLFGAISICLLLLEVIVALRKKLNFTLTKRVSLGWVLASGLIATSAFSAIFHQNSERTLRQVVLLGTLSIGFFSLITLSQRYKLTSAIQIGALVALGFMVFIDLVQLLTWFVYGAGVQVEFGPVNISSPTLGTLAPRPSGLSVDPTRGALSALVMVYLLALDPYCKLLQKSKMTLIYVWSASGVVVLLSGSRTVLPLWALLFVCWLYKTIKQGQKTNKVPTPRKEIKRKSFVFVACILLSTFILIAVIVIHSVNPSPYLDIGALLAERLNFGSGNSAGFHFEMLFIGLTLLASRPEILMSGIGFGNSYQYVPPELVAGSLRGNFHSGYLSFVIETGIFGFILYCMLLWLPIFSARWLVALSLSFFSVTYQAQLDGTFWLALAAIWIFPLHRVSLDDIFLKNVSTEIG